VGVGRRHGISEPARGRQGALRGGPDTRKLLTLVYYGLRGEHIRTLARSLAEQPGSRALRPVRAVRAVPAGWTGPRVSPRDATGLMWQPVYFVQVGLDAWATVGAASATSGPGIPRTLMFQGN
jgi:hypothetical protein